MTGLAEHLPEAVSIGLRRSWGGLWVRMPIAHIVKPFLEQPLYLPALSQAIWHKLPQAAAIRWTRSSRSFDPNSVAFKTREELTAGLATAGTRLAMALQVVDHHMGDDEGLARAFNGVLDHAARTRRMHAGHDSEIDPSPLYRHTASTWVTHFRDPIGRPDPTCRFDAAICPDPDAMAAR